MLCICYEKVQALMLECSNSNLTKDISCLDNSLKWVSLKKQFHDLRFYSICLTLCTSHLSGRMLMQASNQLLNHRGFSEEGYLFTRFFFYNIARYSVTKQNDETMCCFFAAAENVLTFKLGFCFSSPQQKFLVNKMPTVHHSSHIGGASANGRLVA